MKFKYIVSFLIAVSTFLPSIAQTAKYSKENPNPFYAELWAQQSPMFNGDSWTCHTTREWIEKLTERAINPPPQLKRRRGFEFFEELNHPLLPDKKSDVLGKDTPVDLNFYCGGKEKTKFFAQCIDETATEIGKLTLYTHLALPHKGMAAIKDLQKKQHVIRQFKQDTVLAGSLDSILSAMQQPENVALWLWTEDFFIRDINEMYLFSLYGLKKLNGNEYCLQAKKMVGQYAQAFGLTMMAFSAIALPLYALGAFDKISFPDGISEYVKRIKKMAEDRLSAGGEFFQGILWLFENEYIRNAAIFGSGITCGLQLPKMVERFQDSFLLDFYFQKLSIEIAKYVRGLKALHDVLKDRADITTSLPSFKYLEDAVMKLPKKVENLSKLFELYNTQTFKGKASAISFQGRIGLAFTLFVQLKEHLAGALLAVGEIDMYRSLAKLMSKHEGKNATYCFAEYIEADAPQIDLQEFWNPFIDENSVVTNTLKLNCDGERRNGVITGPNEGGKSTALKTLPLCLIMAQAFGIVPAKACCITPFTKIATHLNITDDIGQGNSLFKAEVLRAQELLQTIEKLGSREFCFVAFDEMFNSTTPIEGSAAGYSVAKHIGEHDKAICMLATHFALLTDLEKDTSSFTNYKVSVLEEKDGDATTITRLFKLEKGISHQHVALTILRNQGFSGSILATAQKLVAKMTQ